MRQSDLVLLLSLVLVGACGPAGDDADDTDGGGETDGADTDAPLPDGLIWLEGALAVDVTPDGRTALMQDMTSLEGGLVLVDVATGERTPATTLVDVTKNMATALSADLEISALYGMPVVAGVWSEAGGWEELPSPYEAGCDPDLGGAFDLDDGGDVVVGLMWEGCSPAAFRWTEADGVVPLDRLGEAPEGSLSPPTNRATVVSGDGRVAAGFAANGMLDRSPAIWDADGHGALLDPDEHDLPGEVLSIDRDGSTLAGLRGFDAWVWTEAGGFVDLGRTDGALPSDPVFPNAMTADGRAVLGAVGSDFFGIPTAFVWTADDGMRALQPLVEAAGVDVPEGWLLTNVLAVSDDGGVIFGSGYDAEGMPTTFLLRLDPAAYGL